SNCSKISFLPFLVSSQVPIPPGQVYAINDSLSPEGAADDYETCLKQLVKDGIIALSASSGFPRFDLMLLGMGPDGHIASLFPGHPLINEKERWVTFIKDSPKPPPERITFTFPVINSSAYIAMVVTGAGKASAVLKAFGSEESSADLLLLDLIFAKTKNQQIF
ncbi:probable 6-phosphogluconolactonase 4, chloroplastic, partial [Ananas comosus]|uniref:Probable 6-phosphogluconolactonase 4, chloroplastic n=1 Tax=Ananas comosus TaxID=4615 RepID=A0A6P5F6Y2_ANACO